MISNRFRIKNKYTHYCNNLETTKCLLLELLMIFRQNNKFHLEHKKMQSRSIEPKYEIHGRCKYNCTNKNVNRSKYDDVTYL